MEGLRIVVGTLNSMTLGRHCHPLFLGCGSVIRLYKQIRRYTPKSEIRDDSSATLIDQVEDSRYQIFENNAFSIHDKPPNTNIAQGHGVGYNLDSDAFGIVARTLDNFRYQSLSQVFVALLHGHLPDTEIQCNVNICKPSLSMCLT